MPVPPTLLLPTPCAEPWAAMTPTGPGRHCAACAKTVVDFTQKTDAEILAHFRQSRPDGTCGRFRAAQLGRPLVPRPVPVRPWQGWLAALLLAALATPGCTSEVVDKADPAVVRPPLAAAPPTPPNPVGQPAAVCPPALVGFTVPSKLPYPLPPHPLMLRPVASVPLLVPSYSEELTGTPALEEHLTGDTVVVGKPALPPAPDSVRTH
ncbi:MAG: hypothetical protein ACRYFX_02325 [Janthinobacterium lividum]